METNLNKLRDRVYKISCEHGFHDEAKSKQHLLGMVITDITEAMLADRKDKKAKVNNFKQHGNDIDALYPFFFEGYIKHSFSDELADIVIRLLDLSALWNIDLSELNSKLTESKFKEFLGLFDETFTEIEYILVQWLCDEDLSDKQKVYAVIGGVFFVAYKYKIDLFQHIEWKMRYNELRPY